MRAVGSSIAFATSLLAMLAVPSWGHADEPPFTVVSDACGSVPELEARIRELLPAQTDLTATGITANVVISQGEGGYSLELEIHDHGEPLSRRGFGHRTDCELLVRVAGLIVAMAIDPEAVTVPTGLLSSEGLVVEAPADPPAEAEPPVATEVEPPAASVDEAAALAPPPPSAPELGARVRLHVLGGFDRWSVGSFAPSYGGGLGVLLRRALLEATWLVDGPNRLRLPGTEPSKARVVASALVLAACAPSKHGVFTISGCARIDLGLVHASAPSLASAHPRTRGRIRAAAEVRVGWSVERRVDLELRGFFGGDLLSPRFGVEPSGDLALLPRFDGGLSVAAAYSFR